MTTPRFLQTLGLQALLMGGFANAVVAGETDAPQGKSLPRVLLSGDSICGGYEKGVKGNNVHGVGNLSEKVAAGILTALANRSASDVRGKTPSPP